MILNITQKAGFLFGDHEVGVLPVDSNLQHYLDLKRMPGRNEIQGNYLRDTLWTKKPNSNIRIIDYKQNVEEQS